MNPIFEYFAKLTLDDKGFNEKVEGAKGKFKGFASFLSTAAKASAVALSAIGTATVTLGKQAVDAYKNYEQLAGGIQKLFGEEGAGIVAKYAEQAWMTSGKSMNEYMESVSQISASLKRSIGDDMEEVARVADVAMQAISDNVNTFGSDAQSVENAIMGLSRNNYTMIDNLKLGYAGTAQGMLELINDSGVLGKKLYDTSQLANVGFDKMIEAIQKIQEQQGIAGTTAKEALWTIEGSAKATASAWQNVITSIGRGEGIEGSFENLLTALFGNGEVAEDGGKNGFLNRLLPTIQTAMEGIGTFFEQAVPQLFDNLLDFVINALPSFVNTVVKVFTNLVSKIPALFNRATSLGVEFLGKMGEGLTEGVPKFLENALPMILSFTEGLRENFGEIVDAGIDFIMNLVNGIVAGLPQLIKNVPLIIQNIAGIINDNMPKLFEAGFNIIVALGKGLIDNIPVIVENAGEIFKAIIAVVQAVNWVDLGSKIVTFITNGIKALVSAPVEVFKSIGQNIINTFKNGFSWKGLGKSIIDGIVEGIKNFGSSIGETLLGFVKGSFEGVKNFFGISSPSKLMRDEIGRWIPEGIAEGIRENENSVFDAMSEIPDVVTSGYKSGSYGTEPLSGENTGDLATVIDLLRQIVDGGLNVALEGDASQIFKVVRKQSASFEKAKGYSAI